MCFTAKLIKTNADGSNIEYISFILDALCENFAALYYAKENGNVRERWSAVYKRIYESRETSKGFAQTLLLVHTSYYKAMEWVTPETIGEFAALENIIFEEEPFET